MQIVVHGKSSHVPKALQAFAIEKLEHLSKFISTIDSIDIEIYQEGKPRDGNGHVAHVTVTTGGPVFRSKVVSSDPRACIDIAAKRLERNIKEFKRKRSGKPAHLRQGAKSSDRTVKTSSSESDDS